MNRRVLISLGILGVLLLAGIGANSTEAAPPIHTVIPVILSFSMSPTVLKSGQTSVATIVATNATLCSLKGTDPSNPALVYDEGYSFVPEESATATSSYANVKSITDTNTTTWVVPDDWDPTYNSIEVIGAGAGGGAGNVDNSYHGGGGGGGYSKITNLALTPGETVALSVGKGGAQNTAGGDTYFCSSTSGCASITGSAVVVGAKGGSSANGSTGGAGGAASAGVGSTKFSGGKGGNSVEPGGFNSDGGGGGGGGAAGPLGNGGNGGSTGIAEAGGGGGNGGGSNGASPDCYRFLGACINHYGGAGGDNQQGVGGGKHGDSGPGGNGSKGGGGGGGDDGNGNKSGGNGGNGIDLNGVVGSGGGGGGSGSCCGPTGGDGGNYGGGGGGANWTAGKNGGDGASGVIVISYGALSGDSNSAGAHTSSHVVMKTTKFTVQCVSDTGSVATKSVIVTVNNSANKSCTLDGIVLADKDFRSFYSQQTVVAGEQCSDYSQIRTCNDGTLSGDPKYKYAYCKTIDQNPVTITANGISPETSVRKGSSVTVAWNGGNADTCTVSGTNGSNFSGVSGTQAVVINEKAVFTATCRLQSSVKTATVTVNVLPSLQEI